MWYNNTKSFVFTAKKYKLKQNKRKEKTKSAVRDKLKELKLKTIESYQETITAIGPKGH